MKNSPLPTLRKPENLKIKIQHVVKQTFFEICIDHGNNIEGGITNSSLLEQESNSEINEEKFL